MFDEGYHDQSSTRLATSALVCFWVKLFQLSILWISARWLPSYLWEGMEIPCWPQRGAYYKIELLEINNPVIRTTEYQGNAAILGKKKNKEYYQVFKEKHGFIEDLSIIDLLFNMGPEAQLFLW